MKIISNKKITFLVDFFEPGKPVVKKPIDRTYADLIFEFSKTPLNPEQGLTYEEIKNITKIEEICNKAKIGGKIQFEDSQFDFIKQKISNSKWTFYDKNIVDFVEEILKH